FVQSSPNTVSEIHRARCIVDQTMFVKRNAGEIRNIWDETAIRRFLIVHRISWQPRREHSPRLCPVSSQHRITAAHLFGATGSLLEFRANLWDTMNQCQSIR